MSSFIVSAGGFKEESTGGGMLALARRSLDTRRSSEIRRSSSVEKRHAFSGDIDDVAEEIAGEIEREGRRSSQDPVKRLSVEISRMSLDARRRRASTEMRRSKSSRPSGEVVPEDQEDKSDDEPKGAADFVEAPHDGLTTAKAEELLKKWGKNELTEKVTPAWLVFIRLLIGPMPVMLWCARLHIFFEKIRDAARASVLCTLPLVLILQILQACIADRAHHR